MTSTYVPGRQIMLVLREGLSLGEDSPTADAPAFAGARVSYVAMLGRETRHRIATMLEQAGSSMPQTEKGAPSRERPS